MFYLYITTKMATGTMKTQALRLFRWRKNGVTTEMYLSTVKATVVYTDPDKDICVIGIRYGARWTKNRSEK